VWTIIIPVYFSCGN